MYCRFPDKCVVSFINLWKLSWPLDNVNARRMLFHFPCTFTPMQDMWNIQVVFKIKAAGEEEL